MKTKLPHTFFPLFLILLSFYVMPVTAQITDVPANIGDTIPPLKCIAPIDPLWLDAAKEGAFTGKTLEEPTLRVAYLIPSNRSPQVKGAEALQLVIRTGRDFFKEQMAYNGLDPKTFRYETEADGETPLIHVVNISETDVEIRGENQQEAWGNTINAALNGGLSIWQRGEIWLLVAETHVQLPSGVIEGDIALGASGGSADDPGVAILHSNMLTPLAQGALTDDRAYDGIVIPEIGPYPLRQDISFPFFEGQTLSSVASSNMGAFVHELTHALGLMYHDSRNDRNFHGNLMGGGLRGIRGHLYPDRYPNDYTRLAFIGAQVLNTSHYFNSNKQRNQVDGFSVSLKSNTPQDGKLVFQVTASDADGLSLLNLLGPSDLHVERVLSGTSFNGQIATPYFEPDVTANYRVQVYDIQGNKRETTIQVTPQAGNRAPRPFMQFTPTTGESGDAFQLDASRSQDPNANYPLQAEWDFDNDGIYDTQASQSNLVTNVNLPSGNHLIRVRLTDNSGDQTVSTPMALHVSGELPATGEVSFTLIDVSTNQAIPGFDPISEEAELNLLFLPEHLSIRANVPTGFESVRFDFDGEVGFQVENVSPYALFGDIQGDYNSGPLSLGPHSLSATPFAQGGAKGQSGTKGVIQFSVINKPISFTLVDADNNEDLYTIENGDDINLSTILNKNLNIRTSHDRPIEGLKVHFKLTGPVNRTWKEHFFPYALFGDIDGDYNEVQFPVGTYQLKADFEFENPPPFDVQISHEVTFNIVENEISYFSIHSSPFTGEPAKFSDNGSVFNSKGVPFSQDVAITATPTTAVGSVQIGISGPITFSRIENIAPYSLFGDIDGDFNTRLFPEGEYELTATPYSGPDAQGFRGETLSVTFTIINTGDYTSLNFDENDMLKARNGFVLYPNPAISSTSIYSEKEEVFSNAIRIFNMYGKLVKELSSVVGTRERTIDLSGLAKGIYFVNINNKKEQTTKKLVVQ